MNTRLHFIGTTLLYLAVIAWAIVMAPLVMLGFGKK